MRKLTIVVTALLSLLSSISIAQVNEKKFGAGIIIGEPLGIAVKYWMNEKLAICGDVGFGWAGVDADNYRGFDLHPIITGDLLFHQTFFNLDSGNFPSTYCGIGFRMFFNCEDEDIGIRVPIGITYLVKKAPLDIFIEWTPTYIFEYKKLVYSAGLGLRYYFK